MATKKLSAGGAHFEPGQLLLFELGAAAVASDASSPSLAKPKVSTGKRQRASGTVDETAQLESLLNVAVERLERRLSELEAVIMQFAEHRTTQLTVKAFYTTAEVAKRLGKRPYTVREWCRLGRVRGEKTHTGRGVDEEWRISHEELERLQNEGLLPSVSARQVASPRRIPR